MAVSPSRLPLDLLPLAAAIDVATALPLSDGWRTRTYEAAPCWPLIADAPPFDGVYRGSWISPGVCARLRLDHPAVPAAAAARLRARFSAHVGVDDALYVYGIAHRSQHRNVAQALEDLGAMVQAASAGRPE